MANLSNGADWLKIYDRFHVAQPIPNRPGKHYPIVPVIIPVTLDSYTVAVSCKPSVLKPTWRLGAKIYQLIDVNNSDIEAAKYHEDYPISINEANILSIKPISIYYKLLVDVPEWFADAYIQAWVYTGSQVIKPTDEKLDALAQDLARIEAKLDSYSTT